MSLAFQAIKPNRSRRKSPAQMNAAARNTLRNFLTYLGGEMQKYPPEAARQRYRRTYTLRRGWVEAIGKIRVVNQHVAMVGEIHNTVPYSGRVQGFPDQQEKLFKDRGWKSVSDEADRIVQRFPGDVQIAIYPVKD